MRRKMLVVWLGLLAAASAAAAQTVPGYSYAQIYFPSSTVTLASYTPSGDGEHQSCVQAVRCVFPTGGAVRLNLKGYYGSTVYENTSIVLDSTAFERESSGAGQYISGWVPIDICFNGNSFIATLNNTGLGTNTINCWLAWAAYYIPE
jgi:hypothetical protein